MDNLSQESETASQRDPSKLDEWASKNLMMFRRRKCKALHLGYKTPTRCNTRWALTGQLKIWMKKGDCFDRVCSWRIDGQVDSENMESDASCGYVAKGKEVAATNCSEGKCD